MRLRKNAKMHEAIKHFDDVVLWDENAKNYFAEFKNLKIEIGMGKGKFLTQKAQLDKEDFFVGIESQTEVAYLAALKVKENNSSNIKIIKANAENINEWFLPEQVSTIYINFCDPWPKARHAKRRLVSRNFIEKYKKIVTSDAEIYFKTDNKALFEYALDEFKLCGLQVKDVTTDLHNSNIANPVWTEYEEKFYKFGMKICFCKATFLGEA